MTDYLIPKGEFDQPELMLVIHNDNGPIEAAMLGGLLTVLGADYRRLTGRTLVIARLEQGSTIVWLREAFATLSPYATKAVEFVQVAIRLRKFVQTIRDLIRKSREQPQTGDLFRGKRRPGIKSAEKLLQIAIDAQSEVEFQHKLGDGEELSFRITPREASSIRDQAKSLEAADAGYFLPKIGHSAVTTVDPDLIAGRLALLTSNDPDSISAVISAFAAALQESGMGHLMHAVANKLDERGLHSLADNVRDSVVRGISRREPPLQT